MFEATARTLLIDRRIQNQLREYMPPEDCLQGLVDFFGVLSDRTRLKIISALTISSMCVTDLSVMLSLNQTTLSHQLRLLKTAGAVTCKRQGKVIFYKLANERLNEVMLCGIESLGY